MFLLKTNSHCSFLRCLARSGKCHERLGQTTLDQKNQCVPYVYKSNLKDINSCNRTLELELNQPNEIYINVTLLTYLNETLTTRHTLLCAVLTRRRDLLHIYA